MLLARFAFWFKDGCAPAWYMVPFEPGRPIDLLRLRWLRTCNPDTPVHLYEIFDVQASEWVEATAMGRVVVDPEAPVVLIRAWNVDYCPMFGFELGAIYRTLGYSSIPPDIFKRTSEFLRVIIWVTSKQTPIVHWIPFMNAQREIRLYNHFTLFYVTLAGRETVDVWMADSTKWTRASARSRIRVHPNMDTILLKLPEASVTPGADDALIHLERGFAQRPEWLPSMAAVKWRNHMAIELSVSPEYDVDVASSMWKQQTKALLRVLGAIDYVGSSHSAQDDETVLGKRVADNVDLGNIAKKARVS